MPATVPGTPAARWLKNDLADGWSSVTGFNFGTADPASLDKETVLDFMLKSGAFAVVHQLLLDRRRAEKYAPLHAERHRPQRLAR